MIKNLLFGCIFLRQFKMMRTRSVPRQVKPHPLLTEVTAHQPEFTMENISGTIVGFRF
jgi:acetolactate decarboxylase